MKFTTTPLKDVILIEPKVFSDHRGFFMESYSQKVFAENGIRDSFVQDNVSRSGKGTLRGLHYQTPPHAQGKLVRVTEGEVFDVAVDIRRGSDTFGKWFGTVLSSDNKMSMFIPAGFAHGFLVLSDTAEFTYKCTDHYAPACERGIIWNDPRINIQWPITPDTGLMSPKDKDAPTLDNAEIPFTA